MLLEEGLDAGRRPPSPPGRGRPPLRRRPGHRRARWSSTRCEPAERANAVTTILPARASIPTGCGACCQGEFAISLGGGLGDLQGRAFRIGHLGDVNATTILGVLGRHRGGPAPLRDRPRPGGLDAAIDWLAATRRIQVARQVARRQLQADDAGDDQADAGKARCGGRLRSRRCRTVPCRPCRYRSRRRRRCRAARCGRPAREARGWRPWTGRSGAWAARRVKPSVCLRPTAQPISSRPARTRGAMPWDVSGSMAGPSPPLHGKARGRPRAPTIRQVGPTAGQADAARRHIRAS